MFELTPSSGPRSLERLKSDMDGLWSRFFEYSRLPWSRREAAAFIPQVDIQESDQEIEMTVEVPGMAAQDIEVTLGGDLLTIKGEKKDTREETKGNYHMVERHFGSFQRSFRLPVPVDQANLKATHKDGVLKLVMPKTQKAEAQIIEIHAE